MIDFVVGWPQASVVLAAAGIVFGSALLILAWVGIPGVDRLAGNTVQRLAKNSAAPIGGQLFNRAVDLVFAAFVLRLLGVDGNGEYAVAVVAWLYLKTVSDFGLSVLVTREAARAPARSGALLGASTLLRLAVLVGLLPMATAYAVAGMRFFDLSRASAAAIGLLTISIVPGSYTESINSIFNARERMELPAALNVLTNLARAGFGLAALAAGLGVVGLGAVALLATTLSMLAYHIALRHVDVRPVWSLGRDQARWLVSISWPLLLNALLLNVFFRADVFVIQAIQGDRAVGVYDAAYKFVNTVLLVPSYFTLAVFPILSRYASADHDRLTVSYELALKFMMIIAWPITLGTVTVAPLLIQILGGSAFLPNSAVALRILIWFVPFSYVNAITQYVLIAVDRQRSITRAFGIAVAFNLVANGLLVPFFSFYAAAAVTVATELVLFVPLWRATRLQVGGVRWGAIALRPALAAAAMGCVVALSSRTGELPAALLGGLAYAVALVVFGAVGRQEARIARALLSRPGTAMS